ncbi:unnamed protein product [Fusarium fujikuroi]|uniref:Uncharacterized protein n=1 Tax=Fusarium fujikuroi TaxID=5127 RepID=A0A9Q9RUT5_FUSFU|nr:unnamed protein product [Fusarium fujikuroi]
MQRQTTLQQAFSAIRSGQKLY